MTTPIMIFACSRSVIPNQRQDTQILNSSWHKVNIPQRGNCDQEVVCQITFEGRGTTTDIFLRAVTLENLRKEPACLQFGSDFSSTGVGWSLGDYASLIMDTGIPSGCRTFNVPLEHQEKLPEKWFRGDRETPFELEGFRPYFFVPSGSAARSTSRQIACQVITIDPRIDLSAVESARTCFVLYYFRRVD